MNCEAAHTASEKKWIDGKHTYMDIRMKSKRGKESNLLVHNAHVGSS